MAQQRRAARGVDPATDHYAVSATRMKSGLVHLHLTSYVASPRRVCTDCMLETTPADWNLTQVAQLLYAATDLAADRLSPTEHREPPVGQLGLW